MTKTQAQLQKQYEAIGAEAERAWDAVVAAAMTDPVGSWRQAEVKARRLSRRHQHAAMKLAEGRQQEASR